MNRVLPLLLVLGAAARGANVEDEIRQAEKTWATAVVGGDFAAVERLLADPLIYAHSTGVIDTKSDYLSKLRSAAQKYDRIEHRSMTIRPYGDAVVVHARMRMAGTNRNGPFDDDIMMLHLWVKREGRWQLAAHQTTKLQ